MFVKLTCLSITVLSRDVDRNLFWEGFPTFFNCSAYSVEFTINWVAHILRVTDRMSFPYLGRSFLVFA